MKKFILAIFTLFWVSSFAQITVDLGNRVTGTLPIIAQKITKITVIDALPASNYMVTVTVKNNPTPLSIPTGNAGGAQARVGACKALDDLIDAFEAETEESKIRQEITSLKAAVAAADTTRCQPSIDKAKKDIDATVIEIPVSINAGEDDEIHIDIARGDKKWSFVFKNDHPSHWTTFYGFTYVPDILTRFNNYYANPQDNGKYLVSKMNGSRKNIFQNLSPTAMFTYRFFDKKPDALLQFGITGGIMYNTDILGAMFGPSLAIDKNVTINTGISFLQKYKLEGVYKSDGTQIITENLDFDQLHEKVWTYDIFFSIGFNIPEMFGKKTDAKTK